MRPYRKIAVSTGGQHQGMFLGSGKRRTVVVGQAQVKPEVLLVTYILAAKYTTSAVGQTGKNILPRKVRAGDEACGKVRT